MDWTGGAIIVLANLSRELRRIKTSLDCEVEPIKDWLASARKATPAPDQRQAVHCLQALAAELDNLRLTMQRLYVWVREERQKLQKRQPPFDFSDEQIRFLRHLNGLLSKIQNTLQLESQSIWDLCAKIRPDGSDEHADFELECSVQFFLLKDDPLWNANSDNIVAELDVPLKRGTGGDVLDLDEGENWNEFRIWPEHPLKENHHCWLFHDLYDHTGVTWNEIMKIGSVWVDVIGRYQREYHVVVTREGTNVVAPSKVDKPEDSR